MKITAILGEALFFTTVCKSKHTVIIQYSSARSVWWSWHERRPRPGPLMWPTTASLMAASVLKRHRACTISGQNEPEQTCPTVRAVLSPSHFTSPPTLHGFSWPTRNGVKYNHSRNERKQSRAKTSSLNFLDFPFHFIFDSLFFSLKETRFFVTDFFKSSHLTNDSLAAQKPYKGKWMANWFKQIRGHCMSAILHLKCETPHL